jgi:chromosome segregation ATPase
MIVNRLVVVGCLAALSGLVGCQTTSDPRQGGLFSYNPQAYEQRLAERQARLEHIERQTAAEQQRSRELEATLDEKEAERQARARDLEALDEDIAQVEAELQAFEGKTAAAEQKHWQLGVRLKSVKKQLAEVRAEQHADVEEKKQEIDRLRRTLDRLLAEAEALSKM